MPIALAVGAWLLNKSDKENDLRIEKQKADIERAIATDRQQQSTLEAYFDKMADFLLNSGLRTSENDSEIRTIARARTLAVLRSLDSNRKSQILRFLYESELIDKENTIVKLKGADFNGIELTEYNEIWAWTGWGVNLRNANLEGVELQAADLRGADLQNSNLSYTKLNGAILRSANLNNANFFHADLRNVDFDSADLVGAWVKDANMKEANLINADTTDCNLRRAILENTMMPDGNNYHPAWFDQYKKKKSDSDQTK